MEAAERAALAVTRALAALVGPTLGPLGRDVVLARGGGGDGDGDEAGIVISNDGATVLRCSAMTHPVGLLVREASLAQEQRVGDGTSTVVLLCHALLERGQALLLAGERAQDVVQGFQRALRVAVDVVEAAASDGEWEALVATTLAGKVLEREAAAVAALLDRVAALDRVRVIGVPGAPVSDTELVDGLVWRRPFSYAGHREQPAEIDAPRVLVLDCELEWKPTHDQVRIEIGDARDVTAFAEAEYTALQTRLDAVFASGANVVLSTRSIGDLATQFFARHGIRASGRVPTDVAEAVAGRILADAALCTAADARPACSRYSQRWMGGEPYECLLGVPGVQTVLVRGGAQQVVDEARRAIDDVIAVGKVARGGSRAVMGGGAPEMAAGAVLRRAARGTDVFAAEFARALEVIPVTLARNADLPVGELLGELRQRHAEAAASDQRCDWSLDLATGTTTAHGRAREPVRVKVEAWRAASEVACTVLLVDFGFGVGIS